MPSERVIVTRRRLLAVVGGSIAGLAGCGGGGGGGTESPTDSPTATPTDSPTPSPTDSPTPTETPTASPTHTETPEPTPTDTPIPTPTPTATPTPTPSEAEITVVDSFEDGNITEYEGSTGNYEVTQDSPVGEGSYSLKSLDTGSAPLISTSGLGSYPSAGDNVAAMVAQTDVHPFVGFAWGAQDTENFYWTRVDTNADNLDLWKMDGGSASKLDEAGITLDDVGTVYQFVLDWGSDGTMEVAFQSTDGNVRASVSAQDTTFGSGGIGLRQGGMLDHVRFW